MIGCVDNDAFNGRYSKNPYNFKHYDIRQLKVYLDGQQHSLIPIEPNVAANHYITAYANLFAGTGKLMKDAGTDIRREDFVSGYALYAFDLTPDLAKEGHFNLMKHENVRLDLKFGTALPNTINGIANAQFESVLEIDKSRNIIVDYKNWKDERDNYWALSIFSMSWTIHGCIFKRYSTDKYKEKTSDYNL